MCVSAYEVDADSRCPVLAARCTWCKCPPSSMRSVLLFSSCSALGNGVRAVAAYKLSLEADPGFKEGWTNMGQALKVMGLREESLIYQQFVTTPRAVLRIGAFLGLLWCRARRRGGGSLQPGVATRPGSKGGGDAVRHAIEVPRRSDSCPSRLSIRWLLSRPTSRRCICVASSTMLRALIAAHSQMPTPCCCFGLVGGSSRKRWGREKIPNARIPRALALTAGGGRVSFVVPLRRPRHKECLHLAAICLHALGAFSEAAVRFTQLLQIDPESICYCQREMA